MKIKIDINGVEKEVDYEEIKNYEEHDIHVIKNNHSYKYKSNAIKGRITGAMPMIVTCIYLLIGFTCHIWHPTWLLFLLIPLVPIVLFSFGNGKKSITSIVTFVVIISYIILGTFGLWHPGWLVFFLIPITGVLAGEED